VVFYRIFYLIICFEQIPTGFIIIYCRLKDNVGVTFKYKLLKIQIYVSNLCDIDVNLNFVLYRALRYSVVKYTPL